MAPVGVGGEVTLLRGVAWCQAARVPNVLVCLPNERDANVRRRNAGCIVPCQDGGTTTAVCRAAVGHWASSPQ